MRTFTRVLWWTLGLTVAAPGQGSLERLGGDRTQSHGKLLTLSGTDTWELAAAADEVVFARVRSEQFDPVLELWDGEDRLCGQDDGPGTQSALLVRFAKAGTVKVRVHGFEQKGGGQYQLDLDRWVAPAFGLGEVSQGRFTDERRAHGRVMLRRGDVLVAHCDGGALAGAVDVAGRRILPFGDGLLTAEHDGEYHVRMEGARDQDWRLHLSVAERRPLPGDGELVQELPRRSMVVWEFTLPPLGLRIGELLADDALLTWRLVPGEDTPRCRHTTVDVPQKRGVRRVGLVAVEGGRYQLEVRSQSDQPVPYRLRVQDPAVALVDGRTTFQLPRGGLVLARVAAEPGEVLGISARATAVDPVLTVLGRDGTVVASCDDRGPLDRDASVLHLADAPGPYYVVLRCAGDGGAGAVEVELQRPPLPALRPGAPLRVVVPDTGTAFVRLDDSACGPLVFAARGPQPVRLGVVSPQGTLLANGPGPHAVTVGEGRHTLRVERAGGGTCDVVAFQPWR